MKYEINTDGGARGNPGPAGIGYVIKKEGKVIKELSKFIGEATNNVAEYRALVEALSDLKKVVPKEHKKDAEIEVFMDSELIIKQLNDTYQIKDDTLAKFFIEIHNLKVGTFPGIRFTHVPRSKNKRADELVNIAIDKEAKK